MNNTMGIAAIAAAVISLCVSGVSLGIAMNKSTPAPETTQETVQDSTSTQYVMYVGTNDKDTYAPKYTEEEAREIVDSICLKNFEGYTLQDATGSWVDEKNNVTHKYTVVCYFDDADRDTVYRTADELIKVLNQNTILIEENEIKYDYYGGQ